MGFCSMLLLSHILLTTWLFTAKGEETECSIPILDPKLNVFPREVKYRIGDLLRFSCRSGHRVGPDSVQCYHFGWSPSFPTCKGQVGSCAPPLEIHNGEIKGTKKVEYSHDDVVEYGCKPRFLLKGPNKIQCVDGKWTSLPVCVEEERTCGDIPELEHGSVKFSVPPYHHGDSVEFTCAETFTMIGHGSVSCISGRWTQLPQCVATNKLEKCKALKSTAIEAIQPYKNEFNHNSSMNYKCREKQEYERSTCINGKWDPEPNCTRKEKASCPPPPQIPNAQVIETTVTYLDGEKVSVLCKDNYLPLDTEEMVCKDGRWQSLPRCIVKPCDFPQFKHGHLYNEERWRPYFPVPIGKQYSYYCENGFSTPSNSYWDYLHCTTQGWEPEVPCLRQCVFHYVENGQSLYQQRIYIEGQSVKVQCNKGYSLPNGQDTMTCTENGWSPPPKCVRINSTEKCGPPPPIDNGDITSLSLPEYEPLSSVEYQCQNYYLLKGEKTITCRNGKWSEPPTCLNACVIKEDIMERHNIILRWRESKKVYTQSGQVIEFTCKPRYRRARGSPPFRTQCINGHINYPTCV